MKIFEFLINKKRKIEESEEDKIRKEILNKDYNRAFLFWGEYERDIEVNGKTITYSHSECFLADSKYASDITRFIRLTGKDINGKPIDINKKNYWSYGEWRGTDFYLEENGIEYKIEFCKCLDASWLNNHYISGNDIVNRTNKHNSIAIECKLERIEEQESIDEMFGK